MNEGRKYFSLAAAMKPVCRPFDQARDSFTGFDWPLRSPYTFLVARVSIKSAIQSWQRATWLMAGAFALAALTACSAEPTGQPVTTAPIPADARVLDDGCTMLGELACRFTSGVHGDAGLERRSACTAYVSPNGTRTEQCGSLPVSQP